MQLLLLIGIFGLLGAAHNFVPPGELQEPAFSAALAFGFVLLSALFAGRVIERLRMPKVTGYLLAGMIAGPYALELLTEQMVGALSLVDGAAISLIALTAGGELNLKRIAPLFRVVRAMTLWAVVGTAVLLTLACLALSWQLPFLANLTFAQSVCVSAVIGITLASQSPAVVIALLEETRSKGPLSQTVLALVVISDLIIVILFAISSAIANVVLGGAADPMHSMGLIAWELFGSMLCGVVVGFIMAVYLANIKEARALFVLVTCIVVAEVGRRVHLDPLIVMLVAGVFIENISRVDATHLIHEIESVSLPVYLVFFAVAGAILRLDLFTSVAVPAGVLVVVRAIGFWWGSRRAGLKTDAPAAVTRYAWLGLLPQAGLALALALLIRRSFPEFGTEVSVLILTVVGINQLVTPVLLRFALVWSKEAGKRPAADGAPSNTDAPADGAEEAG